MPRNALLLLSRLLLAALFVPSGFQALSDIAGTTSYFATSPAAADARRMGHGPVRADRRAAHPGRFPDPDRGAAARRLLHRRRLHRPFGQGGGDAMLAFLHSQMLMKDIAISGGFLALAMAGAGAWSADGRASA